MCSIHGPTRILAKTLIVVPTAAMSNVQHSSMSRRNALTGAYQYHGKLGIPVKGCAIKGSFICNNWDLEPLDLLNGLALGCYHLSPEV